MKTSKGAGGGPPDDHPRRCGAKARHSQERCRRWALKESNFCQFHGGRRRDARKNGLPMKYGKHLGDTLKVAVKEFLDQPHHEQVSVYEELAVSRVAAGLAIKLAEPALTGSVKLKPETIALSISLLKDAMNNVRDMVLAASRIEANSTDKVSIRVLDTFVTQIIRAIYRVCGDDDEIAEAIELEIRETVRLPSKQDEGTDIVPSTVLGMDATITGDDDDAEGTAEEEFPEEDA